VIIYDDAWCRIEIAEGAFPGCYHVTVDDDPKHYLSTSSVGLDNAKADAKEARAQFIEDNNEFGVGA